MYLISWGVLTLAIVIFDFITKKIVSGSMQLYQSIPIIKGVFNITYVRNTGASFGMMKGARWFFILVTVVLIAAIIYYIIKNKVKNKLFMLSASLVIGGGIGNLIDRLVSGAVVDFFDFCIINFAIFNVADCFVVAGVAFMLLYFILEEKKARKKERYNENNN